MSEMMTRVKNKTELKLLVYIQAFLLVLQFTTLLFVLALVKNIANSPIRI
jgi:hypothetical protein